MSKYILFFVLTTILNFRPSHAQQSIDYNENVWFLFNLNYEIDDHWNISNELHLRRSDGINDKLSVSAERKGSEAGLL